ncbi:MAG: TIGR03751 family conjugal transfer lipoprotein [Gammaproteobacteria bacterium]|nr:TIGR03751 family conjugal transfer lipoprotein [Gammaproteobacteria bacterium]
MLALISALAGCTDKAAVLPPQAPTIEAIYAGHLRGTTGADLEPARDTLQKRPVDTYPAPGPARTAVDAIEARFARLANPVLILYVYPHLAEAERVPVPGYFTVFPLYERTEYAAPGEGPLAAPWR